MKLMEKSFFYRLFMDKLEEIESFLKKNPKIIDYNYFKLNKSNIDSVFKKIREILIKDKDKDIEILVVNRKISDEVKEIIRYKYLKDIEKILKILKILKYIYLSLFILLIFFYFILIKRYYLDIYNFFEEKIIKNVEYEHNIEKIEAVTKFFGYLFNNEKVVYNKISKLLNTSSSGNVKKVNNTGSKEKMNNTGINLNNTSLKKESKVSQQKNELNNLQTKKKVSKNEEKNFRKAIVTIPLNVRELPGKNNQRKSILKKGSYVNVLKCIKNGYSLRCYISYGKNMTGWVWRGGLKFIK